MGQSAAAPAIEGHARVLREGTARKPERAEALKFLVHIVQDVRQPLPQLFSQAGVFRFPEEHFIHW